MENYLTYEEVYNYYYKVRGENIIVIPEINKNTEEAKRELNKYIKDYKNEDNLQKDILLKMLGLYIVGYKSYKQSYLKLMEKLIDSKGEKVEISENDGEDAKNDAKFINEIIDDLSKKNSHRYNALKNYSDDEIKNFVFKSNIDYDQSWHLLVSYILYQEVVMDKFKTSKFNEVEFKYYKQNCKCVELMIWMAIAGGISLKNVFKAIDYAVNNQEQNTGEICSYIKEKYIPWEEIVRNIQNQK